MISQDLIFWKQNFLMRFQHLDYHKTLKKKVMYLSLLNLYYQQKDFQFLLQVCHHQNIFVLKNNCYYYQYKNKYNFKLPFS